MLTNKIEVVRCEDCVYFIGNDITNVGHCTMWNMGVVNRGYCYRGETESANEEQCVSCGVAIPEGRQICPQCEGRFT